MTEFHVDTLYDVLNKVCNVVFRPSWSSVWARLALVTMWGRLKILAGRVEQNIVKPSGEVAILPHTIESVHWWFTVESHHHVINESGGDGDG